MIQPAKAPRSKRTRVALVIGAVLAACAAILPQLGIASATPGANYNTSEVCEGKYADKATKLVAFKSFDFYVDGVKTSTEYREVSKLLKPGAEVKVTFELKPECDNTYVGVDVYALPSEGFKRSEASEQRLIARDGRAFSAGTVHTITNTLPECWFQMDVYTGWEYKPGDFTLDKRGRLLLAGTGGSELCVPATTTTSTSTTTTAPNQPAETTTTTVKRTTTSTTEAPSTTTTTKKLSTTSTTVASQHNPSATARQVCDDEGSGFNVTFRNEGNVNEDFVVRNGDRRLDTVTVEGGESETRGYTFSKIDVDTDETVNLTVEANDETVLDEEIVNDCVDVAANATAACDTAAGSGAVLTFSNTGKVDETFTVTRDGAEVSGSPVTVPAGTSEQRSLLSMSEDETAKLVITGEQSDLRIERTVTLNCVEVQPAIVVATTSTTSTTAPPAPVADQAQVLGVTEERPQLAETGFNPTYYALVGLFLLAIGGFLMRSARRLRFTA